MIQLEVYFIPLAPRHNEVQTDNEQRHKLILTASSRVIFDLNNLHTNGTSVRG